MRYSQCVSTRRNEEEPVHTVTVGFGCLDRSLGGVPEFRNRVGDHRMARIAHYTGQSARSRCLGTCVLDRTQGEKNDYQELDRELPSRRRASTIPSKFFHGRYDLRTLPQYYPIPAAPGFFIEIENDACSDCAKERRHIRLPIAFPLAAP
jgi:hypothetical protein